MIARDSNADLEHADLPRDTRYDYTTCTACERPSQNIDTGTMPSGERVCGFCLRLSLGRTFAWLRATMSRRAEVSS